MTSGANVRASEGVAVCLVLVRWELALDVESEAGAPTVTLESVVGPALSDEVEGATGELPVAGVGTVAAMAVDVDVVAIVVDEANSEVLEVDTVAVVSPGGGLVVAGGAVVVASSSESESSLKLSIPESMPESESRSAPSAASSVNPKPVGRAALVKVAGASLSAVGCAALIVGLEGKPNAELSLNVALG